MAKKVKKKTRQPRKKKSALDVDIKLNNVDEIVKMCMKKHKSKCRCSGGGCWLFGSALAMVLSYAQNSSIFWAIIHGIISWIYVVYRIIILFT